MPITHRSARSFVKRACVVAGALLLSVVVTSARTSSTPAVAIVRNIAWSPGDAERGGACELEIFLKVEQLRQQSMDVGLVGVGNHNGRLSLEAERALEYVALRGVPVAKIAAGADGALALHPDALVIDAGDLAEEQARDLLVRCLGRFGAPPAVSNPDRPSAEELAAIKRHLQRYQEAFTTASSAQVAQSG